MSGGQIAALIFAILLLLPGGCFLIFGVGFLFDQHSYADVAYAMIPIGLGILALAGLLFWVAFRRPRPTVSGRQG
jgi:membrane protein implicated in regulation of membrane protease activity